MDDRPMVSGPGWPEDVRLYEVHRGVHHPPAQDAG
jgi:hypothetical protein